MAGNGPAPKDPSTRVRRNKPPVPEQVIEVQAGEQPELPEVMPNGNVWPTQTVRWWRMWAEHPISKDMPDADWFFLLDTAVLHGAYWSGDLKWGPELRNRVVQFGPTPEARAKLRIQFAIADKSEREAAKGQTPPPKKGAKKKTDPRTYLTAVQDVS